MEKRSWPWRTLVAAVALLALGLVAGNVEASFINGSVSFTDSFQTLSASTTAIVSDLNNIDVGTPTGVSGPVGDLSGITAATGLDFAIVPFVNAVVYTATAGATTFTFTATGVSSIIRTPAFNCTGAVPNALCHDVLSFDLVGSVDDGVGGADPTTWAGIWTGQGSCPSTDGANCTGEKTASWSVSLSALGTSFQSPEPGSLILLGAGLLGLVAYRRKAR